MKKILVSLLLIFLLPIAVIAQDKVVKTPESFNQTVQINNWHTIVNKAGASFSILPESVVKVGSDVFFTELGTYDKSIKGSYFPFDQLFRTYVAKRVVNCSTQKAYNISIKTFKGNLSRQSDNVIYNVYLDKTDRNPDRVKNYSTEEVIYEQVCQRRTPNEHEAIKHIEKICSKYNIDNAIEVWKKDRPYAHILEEHYNDPRGKDPQEIETNCRYMEYYLDLTYVQ